MKTVSERALAYREAKKSLGTVKAVANHFAVSIATVSRYLALNDDDLVAIDKGQKNIRDRKNFSGLTTPNSANEITLMEYAAHCEFFTAVQASVHLCMSLNIIRNLLDTMSTKGLIQKNTEYSPHVFSLTARGCVLIGREKPKHYFSAAAIHQRLMRNAVEQSIQETNDTAIFRSRVHCWDIGLFPSVGEHYLEFTSKGKKESALVIIDDYGIAPIRLVTALMRKHDKNKRYAKGNIAITWPDLVTRYLVYTTTELQKKNFETYYKYHSDDFVIKPVIRHINPIWK